MFCKANGYKFAFMSAFEGFTRNELTYRLKDCRKMTKMIDWDNYIMPNGHPSMLEYLIELEDDKDLSYNNWIKWVAELKLPSKYLSPCYHWSIEGQKVAGDYIAKFLKKNGHIE
jgi:hypothetical protein